MNKCDVFLTNVPKKLIKQKKKKQKEEKKASENPSDEPAKKKICTLTVDSEDRVFTIVSDDRNGQLMASDGEDTYSIHNLGNCAVGEKWNGKLIDISGGSVAYLVRLNIDPEPEENVVEISEDAAEVNVVEISDASTEENVEDAQPDTEPAVDVAAVEESSPADEGSDLVKELRKKLRDANLRITALEKQLEELPQLREDKKRLERANKSLTKQVQILEKKGNIRDFENISSELDRYKSECNAKDKEIARLRNLLVYYGSSSKEDAPKAFITGDTSIHSMMFDCMKYRVYFSPGKKTLRFIPDDKGSVTVNDKEVTIPALGRYSNYLKPRALKVEKNGSEILIRLT